jgi:hypothetical protein
MRICSSKLLSLVETNLSLLCSEQVNCLSLLTLLLSHTNVIRSVAPEGDHIDNVTYDMVAQSGVDGQPKSALITTHTMF